MSDKADIKELAVAAWRLEKWLDNLNADRKMAAKSALRSIKKYIKASGVEVKDPVGAKFDPGLAVEVVNNEAKNIPEEELIIIETLAPYVYQGDELVQHARVIIGSEVKEARVNNGSIEEVACGTYSDESSKVNNNVDANKLDPSDDNEDITLGAINIERIMEYAKIL